MDYRERPCDGLATGRVSGELSNSVDEIGHQIASEAVDDLFDAGLPITMSSIAIASGTDLRGDLGLRDLAADLFAFRGLLALLENQRHGDLEHSVGGPTTTASARRQFEGYLGVGDAQNFRVMVTDEAA